VERFRIRAIVSNIFPSEFECKTEGFHAHKSNCKKYYWCLEAAGLGMVAHTFTCPTGLFFSTFTDGCDFRRNVECGDKEDGETPAKSTTESPSEDYEDEDEEEDPRSLKEILSAIKDAGMICANTTIIDL
jgi:hypothetical protein